MCHLSAIPKYLTDVAFAVTYTLTWVDAFLYSFSPEILEFIHSMRTQCKVTSVKLVNPRLVSTGNRAAV